MVVLRLVGDRWTYMDRVAVAVKPTEPLKGRLAEIQKALELESFVGYALYRTEGVHPNLIRPTTPIDVSSNLTKEKLISGPQVVVYVKQADLEQQHNDVVFHNGLLHFREERGIKSVAKDGSDVKAYIEDLSTRLNIADSKDIAEHEAQLRDRIEGEAHRTYWVLTSEFREIQQLKDAEAEARSLVVAAYKEGLAVGYTLHVLGPRLQGEEHRARSAIESSCFEVLADLSRKETSVRPKAPVRPPTPPPLPAPSSAAPSSQQQVVMVAGGGMSKEDMESLMTSMTSLIKATQEQSSAMLAHMQKEFNTVVEALASDMRKSATEIQALRTAVQGTANDEKAAVLAIEREVTQRIEKERQRLVEAKAKFEVNRSHEIQRWMGPRNDASADMAKKLLAEQNESLRALIEEEDAMVEQQIVAMRSLEQGYSLGLYSEALNSVAVEQSMQGMHLAQTTLAMELERVTEKLRAIEAEKAEQRQRAKEEEERQMAEALRRLEVAQANRTTTVVTNGFCAVVGSKGIFSYEDCIAAAEGGADGDGATLVSPPPLSLLPEIKKMLLLFIQTYATPEELHFIVVQKDKRLGIEHVSASHYDKKTKGGASSIDAEALAESYLASLVLETGASSYEIADQLVWGFGITSHPYRSMFVRKLEESHEGRYLEFSDSYYISVLNGNPNQTYHPAPSSSQSPMRFPSPPRLSGNSNQQAGHQQQQQQRTAGPLDFIPYVDILLALYQGREVELLLSICPEFMATEDADAAFTPSASQKNAAAKWVVAASAPSSASDDGVSADEGGKEAIVEHYYYSTVPEFSQWERPAALC